MFTLKRIVNSLLARWFAGALLAALITGGLEKLLWCVTPLEANIQLSNIAMALSAEIAFLTVSFFVLVFAIARKKLTSNTRSNSVFQTVVIVVTASLYFLSVPVTAGAPDTKAGAYIGTIVIIGILEVGSAAAIAQILFLNTMQKVPRPRLS